MNLLVIFAHPGTQGHNTLLRDEVLKTLKRRKTVHTTFIDLYKEGFNPVLAPKEHYTASKKASIPKDVGHYQSLIKNADKLIFIYPVWWGSMPAVLKGFFDRVLTSPFAFKYEKKIVLGQSLMVPVGKLKEKTALVLNTTGAPKAFDYATLRFPSLLISKGILGFCGVKSKVLTTNDCTKKPLPAKKKQELKANVYNGLKWLLK